MGKQNKSPGFNPSIAKKIYWVLVVLLIAGLSFQISTQDEDERVGLAVVYFFLVLPFLYALYYPIRLYATKYRIKSATNHALQSAYNIQWHGKKLRGVVRGRTFTVTLPKGADEALTLTTALPIESPHIFLDMVSKETGTLKSSRTKYSDEHRVSLEGNFDQYFHLYSPQKSAPYSLTVVSPDFMQSLLDNLQDVDIEIEGSLLTAHTAATLIDTGDYLERLLKSLEILLDHIDHLSKSFSPDVLQLHMEPKVRHDNRRHRRLPKSHFIGAIIVFVAAFFWGLLAALNDRYSFNPEGEARVFFMMMFVPLMFFLFGYQMVWWLGKIRDKEPKVLFSVGNIQFSRVWTLVMSIVIVSTAVIWAVTWKDIVRNRDSQKERQLLIEQCESLPRDELNRQCLQILDLPGFLLEDE